MIALISFLLAASSFLNEMNLAQSLTAVLGGTAIRYQTTFGLFTFFLGLGALFFDILKAYISTRKILLYSQLAMILIGLLGPVLIKELDPITRNQYQTLFILLSYLPVCMCGLISGFELPALISSENNLEIKKFNALAWDYLGMFSISIAFPLWLLYSFGVVGVSIIATCLSLLSFIIIYKSKLIFKQDRKKIKELHPIFNFKSLVYLFLCFLLSFCSFCYELLIAKVLGDIFNNETLAYSAGIGFLLLGLGLGALYAEKIGKPLKALINVELLLIAFCSLQFALIHGLAALAHASLDLKFITENLFLAFMFFSPFPLIIGFLTGLELPLILKLYPFPKRIGLPVAMNYTGALFAGFLTPFFLLPVFAAATAFQFVCCINILALTVLILMQKNLLNLSTFAFPVVILVFFIPIRYFNHQAEQIFLKTYYYELNLTDLSFESVKNFLNVTKSIPEVQRFVSIYQNIDVIKKSSHPYFGNEGTTLYLNKQPQFDSKNWMTYHKSMVLGAFNIQGSVPQNILICGGGDGILARVLLSQKEIDKITLIELDSKILELARSEKEFLKLNQGSLNNPRVQVINDDAYNYLHSTYQTYDAIFVDFPYPDNFDLGRLYSLEFYKILKNKLSLNGFLIFDAPIRRYMNMKEQKVSDQQILEATLNAAGFKSLFPFGSIEPFIFASNQERHLNFNYSKLPEPIENRTFVNMVSLGKTLDEDLAKTPINSIYHPVRFFRNE